uniref:Timeless n=1 Tax=Tritonia tetraquetra TaxID=2780533 RepID=A0A2Z4QL28_9GAST|nr:timeless [Tritonia tetraquetra]
MSSMNSSSCLMDMDIFLAYLKKFATDIVYTGLVELVEDIMKALMTKYESVIDHSLLMWTVGFFLSFSQQQELELVQIKEILNMDLFGFLVYEGVKNCEALMMHRNKNSDCAVEKHRLHLVVCTLNQMFRTLLANNKTEPVKDYLHSLQKFLSHVSNLRNLFVLLIRQHVSSEQSQTYLCDLVQTNHVLMLLIEEWLTAGFLQEDSKFSLLTHVNQFATNKVMAKYGSLLEQEDGNRGNLNTAVLTMMYHVAGSCHRHDTLIQLPILKVFSDIWMESTVREESKLRAAKTNPSTSSLYDHEFKDLIEFILKIFMTDSERDNSSLAEKLFANVESPASYETESLESMNTDSGLFGKELGEEEQVLIISWMSELPRTEDTAKVITCRLQDHGFYHSTEVVRKHLEEYGYLEMRPAPDDAQDVDDGVMAALPGQGAGDDNSQNMNQIMQELSMVAEEELIPYLVGKVKEKGHGEHLVWLQTQLMEAAYVKLGLQDPGCRIHAEEPVARFYALQNKAIPLVPWCEQLEQALASPYWILLQKCLGLYCDDPNIIFPRIPQYLTPYMLVDMARRIGSIDMVPAKFDVTALKQEPMTMGMPKNDIPAVSQSGSGKMEDTLKRSKPTVDYQWLNMVQAMNV